MYQLVLVSERIKNLLKPIIIKQIRSNIQCIFAHNLSQNASSKENITIRYIFISRLFQFSPTLNICNSIFPFIVTLVRNQRRLVLNLIVL